MKTYGINTQGGELNPCFDEHSDNLTVCHRSGIMKTKSPPTSYVVRRLTPTECERLMGLPDNYTVPQFAPNQITDELVDEFRQRHDTFKQIMVNYGDELAVAKGKSVKPTSAKSVRKWLERISNPTSCPEAPRYKACGNGWAVNQPRWLLLRLLAQEGIDPWHQEVPPTTSPCVALDGDKLKPREGQHKGGNGFGINDDNVGYTLTGIDRHGVAQENL